MAKLSLSDFFLTITGSRKDRGSSLPGEIKVFQEPIQVIPDQRNRLLGKEPQKTPSLFRPLALLAILFFVASLLVLSRASVLKQENKHLTQEIRTLETVLLKLQGENRVLIEKSEKETRNLKDASENYKKENETLQFQLQKINQKLDSISEEKSYLEEILVNKTKEIEKIKKAPRTATPAAVVSGSLEEVGARLREKEEEVKSLTEDNQLLSKKLDKLYQTANQHMAEINVAKMTLEESIFQAREKLNEEWNTVDLGSIAVSQGATSPLPQKGNKAEARKTTKKEGHILAINEDHGFVIVDMGKVDGIKSDSVLTLKKNNQTVATLTVIEVRDVMTACNLKDLSPNTKVEINDQVSIQK